MNNGTLKLEVVPRLSKTGHWAMRRAEMTLKWIWMLLASLVFNGPVVLGTCPETMISGGGTCYKMKNAGLSWKSAVDQCKNETGSLSPMSFYKFLTAGKLKGLSLLNYNCYWANEEYIALYVMQLRMYGKANFWTAAGMLAAVLGNMVLKSTCIALCKRGTQTKLDLIPCTNQLPYICGFDEAMFVERKTPQKNLVGKKSPKTVVVKTEEKKCVIGDPEFIVTLPMVTMCSRVCLKSEVCGLLNYNKASKECRGYNTSVTHMFKVCPFWDVWVIKTM